MGRRRQLALALRRQSAIGFQVVARAIRTLGEIALRVNDLEVMREFYEKTVGLELMRQFPGIVFFRIGEGYGGHTTILALFDRDRAVGIERSTLDHLALTIDIADYETERKR
jgi:catechol-2,3-dioxygenase